jgi:hypothetical protein
MLKIDSNTLNCILIGFIIAVLLIMFVRMTSKRNKEDMYFIDRDLSPRYRFDDMKYQRARCDSESLVDSEDKSTKSTITDDTASKAETKSSISEEIQESQENILLPVEKEKERPKKLYEPKQYCDLNEMEDMNHRLVRDVVVGRRFQQGEKQHEFSKDEVDNYFLEFQNFNDKVNYSSQNRCDMVEKLAQDRTHNNELINKQGLTIGDVFDGMTKDQLEKMKQCKYPNCVQPAHYDNLTQRQYYVDREGTKGATYSNFNARYETDNENNGGKFFNDIEAHDTGMLSNMAYKL